MADPEIRSKITVDDSQAQAAIKRYNKMVDIAAEAAEDFAARTESATGQASKAWGAESEAMLGYAKQMYSRMNELSREALGSVSVEAGKVADQWRLMIEAMEWQKFGSNVKTFGQQATDFFTRISKNAKEFRLASDEAMEQTAAGAATASDAMFRLARDNDIVSEELKDQAYEVGEAWVENMAAYAMESREFAKLLAEQIPLAKRVGSFLSGQEAPEAQRRGEYILERVKQIEFLRATQEKQADAAERASERQAAAAKKAAQAESERAQAVVEGAVAEKKAAAEREAASKETEKHVRRINRATTVLQKFKEQSINFAQKGGVAWEGGVRGMAEAAAQYYNQLRAIAEAGKKVPKKTREYAADIAEGWAQQMTVMSSSSQTFLHELTKYPKAIQVVVEAATDVETQLTRETTSQAKKREIVRSLEATSAAKQAERLARSAQYVADVEVSEADRRERRYKQVTAAMRGMNEAIEKANKEAADSAENSVRTQIKAIRDLRWQIITFMFYFRTAGRMIKKTWEAMMDTSHARAAADAMRGLAESVGTDADAIAKSLRGTNEALMSVRRAMQITQAGLTEDMGQFASHYTDLWNAAQAAAVITGEETIDVFGELVGALAEGDAAAVDTVMRFYNAETAMQEYAASVGKTVDEVDRSTRQQIILNRIQETTNDLMETSVADAVEQEEALQAIADAWLEMRDAMALVMGEDWAGFLGEIADQLHNIAVSTFAYITGIKALYISVDSIEFDPMKVGAELADRLLSGEGFGSALYKALGGDELDERLDRLVDDVVWPAFERLGFITDQAADEVEDSNEKIADSTEDMADKIQDQTKQVNEYLERMADAYRDAARRIEDLDVERMDRREDAWTSYFDKEEDIWTDYYDNLEDLQDKVNRDNADAYEDYQQKLTDIAREYADRRWEIQQDFRMTMWEAVGERDALAAFRAQMQRDFEIQKLDRWYARQREEAGENYEEQLEDNQDYLEDKRKQIEKDRRRSLRDARRHRRRELRDINTYYNRQLRDINTWLRRKVEDINDWWDAQYRTERAWESYDLQAQQNYLTNKLQQWIWFYNSLSGMSVEMPAVPESPPGYNPNNPWEGPYDMYAKGGAFIADRPTPIIVGEGAYPEMVQITPMGGQSSGSMRMNHQVGGRITASMDGMQGRLTAMLNDVVMGAMEDVLKVA